MAQSAFLKFTDSSSVPSVSLEDVKQAILRYKDQLAMTGKQLGWEYDDAGFPYTIETKPDADGKWFYLKGKNDMYHYILMGVGVQGTDDPSQPYVQVTLPDGATHGDKGKANELCKYLGKAWKTELHLFNGRIMYFNPRK